MKEIKGTLEEWRTPGNTGFFQRFTTFRVNGKQIRGLIAHNAMLLALKEISGESTFFIKGKEVFAVKNGSTMYMRENIDTKKSRLKYLFGLALMVWPFLVFMLFPPSVRDMPTITIFAYIGLVTSLPLGVSMLVSGLIRTSAAKAGDKINAFAEKENLRVIEV